MASNSKDGVGIKRNCVTNMETPPLPPRLIMRFYRWYCHPRLVNQSVKKMLGLILISNVIAWPLAWYLMNQWLERFAYRIGNELWIYICAGFAMVIIALMTMSFQSVKAALTNPVNSLKHE
jgi:hypothetical protein